jgi:hypothetical protein
MKYSSLITFFLLYISANSQTTLPVSSDGKILFAETIRIDSSDAASNYVRAKTWVLENFSNLKTVLQKDDVARHFIQLRVSGECYAPHSFGDTIENAGNSYSLTLQMSDNGYSYSLTDFMTTDKWKGELAAESVKGSKKQLLAHEQSIHDLTATLTASLKKAMATKISVGID